jgi:urease accessory protein
MSAMSVAALLLGDSRFPAGGHAHSGGVEAAVTAGTVTDLLTLEWFLRGRLRTAGLVAAGLAAAACAGVQRNVAPGESAAFVRDDGLWGELDAEADARTPAPAQREASRVAAYQAVAGPASAAVRVLALDPMRATGILAGLARDIDQIAAQGAAYADSPLGDLPCASAPALDLLAETHIRAEVRLFES